MNMLVELIEAVRKELRAMFSTREEIEREEKLLQLEELHEHHKKDSALFATAFMGLSDKYKKCRKDRMDLLLAAKDVVAVAREATRNWNMGEDMDVNKKLLAIANNIRDYDPRLTAFHNVIERMEKEDE